MGGKGVSLSASGLSEFEAQNAFETALINQGVGGGGGGGGLVFPDTVVTGTGMLTIPVGFNAIVKVVCDPENTFSINGSVVLGFNQTGPSRFAGLFVGGPPGGNPFASLPDGLWRVSFTAGGGVGNTQILYHPEDSLFAPFTQSHFYKGSNQLIANFDLNGVPGGTLTTTQMGGYVSIHGPVKFFPSGSATEFVYVAVREDINNAVSQVFNVPEGDSITGGTYRLVELYAI